MTKSTPAGAQGLPPEGASRREILAHWQPENKEFWERFGKRIAKENLYVSTGALTLAFCVCTLWATVAARLNSVGFAFTDGELFTLAALPGLIGATGRLVYTYLPALMGGRNFTLITTGILLIPLVGIGCAVEKGMALTVTGFDGLMPLYKYFDALCASEAAGEK